MQTILVAHGALGSAARMQPIVDALSAHTDGLFHVESLEFPGHGATPIARADDEQFRLPRFVDVMALAVARCASPPLLFGYSMGGYVGLALEAQSPGSFRGIVTLGTKFEWTPESAERESLRLDPAIIAAKVPKFAEVLAARHEQAGGWESVLLRTAALLRANGGAPLLSVDVLERIGVPVRVAVGTKDETVSVAESRAAASVMLRAEFVELEGVGHPIERVPTATVIDLLRPLF